MSSDGRRDFQAKGLNLRIFEQGSGGFDIHAYSLSEDIDGHGYYDKVLGSVRVTCARGCWCLYDGRSNPFACFWRREEALEASIEVLLAVDAQRRLGG